MSRAHIRLDQTAKTNLCICEGCIYTLTVLLHLLIVASPILEKYKVLINKGQLSVGVLLYISV